MEIKATLSALDFYNQKSGLQDGAYEVVEHDGEINIAVVHGLQEIRWYDQGEWVEVQEELRRELLFEGNMRSMDEWDSLLDDPNDGLEDIDYNAHNCGHMNEGMGDDCSARNLDEIPLKNKYPEPVKTLGELLRESMTLDKINAEHQQMNSPAFNSIHGSMGTKGDV